MTETNNPDQLKITAPKLDKWNRHAKGKYGQDVIGPVIHMTIMERRDPSQNGVHRFNLKCSACETIFPFEAKQGGKNAVVRQIDEDKDGQPDLHAQCPECGSEWNGDVIQYYGIGVYLDDRKPTTNGLGWVQKLGIIGAIQATNILTAHEKALTLLQEIPEKEQAEVHGFDVFPINIHEFRMIGRMQRLHQAVTKGEGDPFQIVREVSQETFEEAQAMQRRVEAGGRGYNPIEAAMAQGLNRHSGQIQQTLQEAGT